MLNRIGYSVDIVENGLQAVQATESKSYDLVFMDMMMPVMDGVTATKQIRMREALSAKRTPIVALTANADPADEKRCVDAGMDAFISKPFTSDQLKKRIDYFVAQKYERPQRHPQVEKQVLNKSILATFVKAMGEDDLNFIKELFSDFLVEANRVRSEFHRGLETRSDRELFHAAHSLKGVAAVFGAEKLIALCDQFESYAKNGQFEEITLRLSSFEGALNETKTELNAYFQQLQTSKA